MPQRSARRTSDMGEPSGSGGFRALRRVSRSLVGQECKQARDVGRHGVMPAGAPGVAARQPPHREVTADHRTMRLQCRECIGRARWLEPTSRPQHRAQQVAVSPHHADQRCPRPRRHTNLKHLQQDWPSHGVSPAGLFAGRPRRRTAASKSAGSWSRSSTPSGSLRALTNSRLSIGARNRTTQSTDVRSGRNSAISCHHRAQNARTCRLTRLRVTALRARRFGTTRPRCGQGGRLRAGLADPFAGKSSTGCSAIRSVPVDNS